VTDTSWNFTPNQWVGYQIRKTGFTQPAYDASEIKSNTSNTITFKPGHDANTTFTVGDRLEIRKVLQGLDSCGRALGSRITGVPVNPPPPGWNNQVTEP